ncbi:MAG: TonB-dependent receptor, partial [Bacteroidales bacterium]|nr:TonB-dependent receptor [Bacteroidales bacterium]
YVPEHSFSGQAMFVFRGFVFSYLQSFTGERYVTRDCSEFLPAYNIGDLQLSKTFDIKMKKIKVQFEIHNIWDEEYHAIQNFPMPGRYFRFLINFIL